MSRRTNGSHGQASSGGTRQSLAAAAKAEEAQAALKAIDSILDLHRRSFETSTRPLASPPAAPQISLLLRKHRKGAVAGVGLFEFAKRREARRRASEAAARERAQLESDNARLQAAAQAELDARWQCLLDNDPDVVIACLAEAFEDNDAAAAPLGAGDGGASVVVLVPDPDLIPERLPGVTDAGNLSLRKMTKRQRNDFYAHLVCGSALVTVKEALAVAPGLDEVTVVAVRRAPADAYGRRAAEAVLAARFTRRSLADIRWSDADAVQVVNDASVERIFRQKGAAAELQPLDSQANSDIGHALEAIDLDEGED